MSKRGTICENDMSDDARNDLKHSGVRAQPYDNHGEEDKYIRR